MSIRGRKPVPDKTDKHRINENINSSKVRLVGEGGEPVVIATSEAIRLAKEKEGMEWAARRH